jgi:hypothetical protein
MQALFWSGLLLLVLGIASLLVPIPNSEHGGIRVGDVSIGVETNTSEKVSPIISAAMILGGAGLMIAAKKKQ